MVAVEIKKEMIRAELTRHSSLLSEVKKKVYYVKFLCLSGTENLDTNPFSTGK